jgi:hypothetical protein
VQTTDPQDLHVDPPVKLQKGTLTVTSRPMSAVIVDGKKVGDTPLMKFKIAPGRHTITLVGPDGQKKAFKQVILPGKGAKLLHNWHKW